MKMTGNEALQNLKSGVKVRRIKWSFERYIFVEDGVVKKYWHWDGKPTTTINSCPITELLNDDWEIYNEWNRSS